MAHRDNVETMARHLVAIVLRNPRWDSRLDELCLSLREDARRASPRPAMMAVAARAETMLRHIAQRDYVAIGRLYFDLLPAAGHPLTEAVILALSQPAGALRLLREAGLEPSLRKDATGASFLEVEIPDRAADICDTTRDAIVEAMTSGGEAPQGALHTLH